jgi:arginase
VLRLLHPEWQGFGLHAEAHHGAQALARAWFGGRAFDTIEAPVDETLTITDGVLGLASIASRAGHALARLRAMAPDRLMMAAGTCACELATVAWLTERYRGDLTVLWLDGHADLNTPASSPSGHFHGMVLRTLLGDGPAALTSCLTRPLTVEQIALVGARDLDAPEAQFVREAGVVQFGLEAFDTVALTTWLERSRRRRLYVHFDVDVIDGADFGGALMTPPPDGPTLAAAAGLVATLCRDFDVVGLSVLEVCDRGDAIARLAAALPQDLVAGDGDGR